MIEDWTDHGEKEDAGRITLTAGQRYAVRLEYFYNGGQGVSKLWWTPPGGTKEAVPADVLHLPAGGRGLRGEYFKGIDLSEAWAQRDDAQVDFAWGVKPPFAARVSRSHRAADRSDGRRLAGRVARHEVGDGRPQDARRWRRDPHVRGACLRHGHRASAEAPVIEVLTDLM